MDSLLKRPSVPISLSMLFGAVEIWRAKMKQSQSFFSVLIECNPFKTQTSFEGNIFQQRQPIISKEKEFYFANCLN
jgi:hypothetical protein